MRMILSLGLQAVVQLVFSCVALALPVVEYAITAPVDEREVEAMNKKKKANEPSVPVNKVVQKKESRKAKVVTSVPINARLGDSTVSKIVGYEGSGAGPAVVSLFLPFMALRNEVEFELGIDVLIPEQTVTCKYFIEYKYRERNASGGFDDGHVNVIAGYFNNIKQGKRPLMKTYNRNHLQFKDGSALTSAKLQKAECKIDRAVAKAPAPPKSAPVVEPVPTRLPEKTDGGSLN